MRTLVTPHSGPPFYKDEGTMPDSLENMLGGQGLSHIAVHLTDGTVTTYSAWEYECGWCGQYGHAESDCAVKTWDLAHQAEEDDEAETEPDDFDSPDAVDDDAHDDDGKS